jgi:4-amino-4-deoxy-L-arabinose transferase-like glycosyltransferase
LIPFSIVLLALLLRILALGVAPLIGDESYYWLWSKHLALSYFDNPPGVALLVRLSTVLGGESEAGIRWLNAALGVLAVWLASSIGTQLLSRPAGWIAAAVLAAGPPYLVISRFVYTDTLQLVLLLANLSLLAPFLRQRSSAAISGWRFAAIGVTMAALLNTKYSAYLYAVVVLITLAWTRLDLFADRRTWWAMNIAAVGFVPAVAWNAAHDWASYRWQWRHLIGPSQAYRPLGNLSHALSYLTPPLLALSLPSLAGLWKRRQVLILASAVVLTVPILLSPANSPRNATVGLTLFLLLGADELARWLQGRWRPFATGVVSLLLALNLVYGLGTVLSILGADQLPHSSVAPVLRWEGSGWREIGRDPLGTLGITPEWPVFALDYNIAGQLRYYARLPVTTGWPQYRFWEGPQICAGEPGMDAMQVIGLAYLEPTVVTAQLQDSFRQVDGPRSVRLGGATSEKTFHLWKVKGCTVTAEILLERLDFLELAGTGRHG